MLEDTENARKAKILIVDDEICIAELLSEMLLILGYEPHSCTHPQVALDRLETEEFDLVLSDFRMPGMNGQQFYKAATERRPELSSKIVFLTGDTGNHETSVFLKNVGNATLAKPFQFGNVAQMIAGILGEKGEAVAA
jgi:CheY-like chemotaxis protein